MNRDLELMLITDWMAHVNAVRPVRVFTADFQDMLSEGRLSPVFKGEPGPEFWLYTRAAKYFVDTNIKPGDDVVVVRPHRIIDAKNRQVWPRTDLDEDDE